MEVEITVLSDRRDGLLREMGRLIIQSGFTLQRQRMTKVESGVELWLRISGQESRLLELEDRFSADSMVLSFESNHDVSALRPSSPPIHTSSISSIARRAVPSVNGAARVDDSSAPPTKRIESELPMLARDYPRIFPRLLSLQEQLPDAQRSVGMNAVGKRVGSWVYRRDYSLGGKLDLHSALKQIALPALRGILSSEMKDNSIRVKNNPLCMPGSRCRSGDFFCGFLQGLLQESGVSNHVTVIETYCRSDGAEACTFEVVD